MNRRILIVTGDAGESYETLYAVHRFREAGDAAAVAAPARRRPRLVMHDFEPGWDTYIERPGYGFEATGASSPRRPGNRTRNSTAWSSPRSRSEWCSRPTRRPISRRSLA